MSGRSLALALCLTAAAACTRQPEVLRPVGAVDGYEATVAAERADKDRQFVVDPDSPLPAGERNAFRGLRYWPPDLRYRLAGPLQTFARPERFTIVTTQGEARPCERFGRLTFELHGVPMHLTVFRLLDGRRTGTATDLFVPFMDQTTGKETYPAGRYVNLEEEGAGRYVLDFNFAYNPSCAYGSPQRFQCPRTPPENRLPVAVEAGERGWHESEAPVGRL